MNRFSTDQLTTVLIVLLLIVFVELTIFNNGGAFLLIITGFLFYYSFKKRNKTYFWSGCVFAIFAVLSVFTLRLFVIAILLYMLYKKYNKPQDDIILNGDAFENGMIHKNDLIGTTSPPLEAYKWQDVQIQRVLGDITIDTTQTILPKGTSVITIRQSIGKVSVIVPYDIPYRLQFTTILGEAKIHQKPSKRLFNENMLVEDGETENAKRKLVIHVATWLGDVGGGASMISFAIRTFTVFIMISSMVFVFFYFLLGEPVEETFRPLWEERFENIPLVASFVMVMFGLSCIVSIWISIASKTKEAVAIRYVKQLADPEFSLENKRNVPRSLRKALLQTSELIETQRKSLQKLTNEKVETNDAIIQERVVQERQRLARELHDSVSQQLFAASMLLSALTEQNEGNEHSQKTLKQVENVVQQAQLEMRALLLHLRPIALRNNTLAEGLTGLILELQQKVNFHIEHKIEEFKLSKAEEDHLFRIAQEALSNTLRHAKATEVELLLIARDNIGILRIQDNGRGFNVEEDKTTSYGLKNIAERAVEIGCIYKIVSVPGEGTIVEVKVPLKKMANDYRMEISKNSILDKENPFE